MSIVTVFRIRRTKRDPVLHFHFGPRGSYFREGMILLVASSLGLRIYATLHGSLDQKFKRVDSVQRFVPIVLRRAEKVFVLNPHTLLKLKDLNVETTLIANPLPVNVSAAVKAKKKIIFFASGKTRSKGFDILLEAWSEITSVHKDWNLVVAGSEGDVFLDPAFDKVIDLGVITQSEVLEVMAESSIVCLPSHSEQSPMVIWEALSLGVPVVATSVGAIPWILGEDYPWMISPGDSINLRHALLSLIEYDRESLRSKLVDLAKPASSKMQIEYWKDIYLS